MKTIGILRSTFTMAVCAIMAVSAISCNDNDPDNLYGKNKDLMIVDNDLIEVDMVYATMIEGGGFNVIGGKGDSYRVAVLDEDVLTAQIYPRGVGHSDPQTWTQPVTVSLTPKKMGETTVVIIDTDTDQIESVKVKVVYRYAALAVLESCVDEMKEGMKICLMDEGENGDNEYRIVSQKYDELLLSETGDYHFEIPENDWSSFLITLSNAEKETTWKVTDADNNREGYDWYESDVVSGIGLNKHVLTKTTETPAYPQVFKFTDITDPERHFKTGPATAMEFRFE